LALGPRLTALPRSTHKRAFDTGIPADRAAPAAGQQGGLDVNSKDQQGEQITVDVREIAPRERHPLIFDSFERLAPGEALRLVNDHDPKPLYYQFMAEHPGEVGWDYLEEGPEVWQVRISRLAS
jgi:uncharacterized protein (DUF2249 family)